MKRAVRAAVRILISYCITGAQPRAPLGESSMGWDE
eukprot:SAG31_NODE_2485_length_5624_cov_2.110206_3_plen_36_part_00